MSGDNWIGLWGAGRVHDCTGRRPGARYRDPMTMGAMAVTAAGSALSAAGTLASGNAAAQAGGMQQQAAYYQAAQTDANAAQAFASGQRTMLETQRKTNLTMSAARARGAASGVDVSTGSPASNIGAIAQRGSYQALMDMFNGESTATGLRNQAVGERWSGDAAEWEGETKQSASKLAAAGTIASGMGKMSSMGGGFQFPSTAGKGSASF